MDYQLSVNAQNILCVAGNIYLSNVEAACNAGIKIISTLPIVQVDLSGIKDADSGSMAMLVEWLRTAKQQQKDIVFNNMPHFMQDLGRVCGLDAVLPVG